MFKTILKICEQCKEQKNMHESWTYCNDCMCGVMILTPTPEHNGGMWCAELKPCKQHQLHSMKADVLNFLKESNAIEGVYDQASLDQAYIAWEYLMKQKTIDKHVICKTHKILMLHQPGLYPDEKGYFRKIPVYIGNKEAMKFYSIPVSIDVHCIDMNLEQKGLPTAFLEGRSRQIHQIYEEIHPFVDGNGRTGRMFMNWWRLKNGLPLLIIKESERFEYYKWFEKFG